MHGEQICHATAEECGDRELTSSCRQTPQQQHAVVARRKQTYGAARVYPGNLVDCCRMALELLQHAAPHTMPDAYLRI